MLVQGLRQHNGGASIAGPMGSHVGVAKGLDIVVFKQGGTVDHSTEGPHLLDDLGQERFGDGFVGQIGLEDAQAGVC
jgi:hypothetical protein